MQFMRSIFRLYSFSARDIENDSSCDVSRLLTVLDVLVVLTVLGLPAQHSSCEASVTRGTIFTAFFLQVTPPAVPV